AGDGGADDGEGSQKQDANVASIGAKSKSKEGCEADSETEGENLRDATQRQAVLEEIYDRLKQLRSEELEMGSLLVGLHQRTWANLEDLEATASRALWQLEEAKASGLDDADGSTAAGTSEEEEADHFFTELEAEEEAADEVEKAEAGEKAADEAEEKAADEVGRGEAKRLQRAEEMIKDLTTTTNTLNKQQQQQEEQQTTTTTTLLPYSGKVLPSVVADETDSGDEDNNNNNNNNDDNNNSNNDNDEPSPKKSDSRKGPVELYKEAQ
ncbi:unnamed protein product, partial [Polarella glacialis]